jgi:hypothetical protein
MKKVWMIVLDNEDGENIEVWIALAFDEDDARTLLLGAKEISGEEAEGHNPDNGMYIHELVDCVDSCYLGQRFPDTNIYQLS